MTPEHEAIADAVLFEGYLLYPYRRSALKNQQWWPFGALYPRPFCESERAGDAWELVLECLVTGASPAVSARLRFLQLADDEAVVRTADLVLESGPLGFDGIDATVTVAWTRLADDVQRLRLVVQNLTAFEGRRDQALRHTMASTHLLLAVSGGKFVSMIDPPAALRDAVAGCRCAGTWPVLIGPPGAADALLAAPIILEDHPQIAPESMGSYFDGTEIDEMLTLRILTLTDDEKRELAASDPRIREMLERTEAVGHAVRGTMRGRLQITTPIGPGASVRLRPRRRADIFDVALAGRRATVESVARDLEGRTYVAVTIDDDPGRDLGAFGHRFFFGLDEVEVL